MEETADEVGKLLQPVQRGESLGLEVVGAGDAGPAHPVRLDVLPDPLVGVELRRWLLDDRGLPLIDLDLDEQSRTLVVQGGKSASCESGGWDGVA